MEGSQIVRSALILQVYDSKTTRVLEGSCTRGQASVMLNYGEYAKSKGGYKVDFGLVKLHYGIKIQNLGAGRKSYRNTEENSESTASYWVLMQLS